MADNNNSALWWILGGVATILGVALILDYKEKKRLEKIVKLMDWRDLLDENNQLHKPLISVSKELVLMLNNSITSKENKYEFKPLYPQSLKLLTRSTYEQTIKLYMKLSKIKFGKSRSLKSRENNMMKHFSEHNPKSDIGSCFKKVMGLRIRDKGNDAAHNPEMVKEVALVLDEVEIFANFVNIVMRYARQNDTVVKHPVLPCNSHNEPSTSQCGRHNKA